MLPRTLRLTAVLVVVLLVPVALSSAQTATPIPDAPPPVTALNLPPIVNASIVPRRVVYLDTESTAGALVMVDATKSEDPEGQPLTYAHDVDGDGVFTPWFFRSEAAELVTMAGPFIATARVRDPLGAVSEQQIRMEARQFSRAHLPNSSFTAAFALVNGRPALAFDRADSLVLYASNDLWDGSGRWRVETALSVDPGKERLAVQPSGAPACQMQEVWGAAVIVCTFQLKSGAFKVRQLSNFDPGGGGEWFNSEVVQVSGNPAPTLGVINNSPAIIYFNSNALALLHHGWTGDPSAVMVGGYEFIWSEDVGSAPPATHSAVVSVGDGLTLPAFAYLNAAKAQLIYAVNQQADGRGRWDLIPVEGQGGDIGTPSLAMIAGRPAIAYRDGFKGHLKLAVADTADGRGKWKVTVVYPAPPASPRTQSLAVVDGRAGIAFEHETLGLLFAYDPGLDTGNYWPVAVVDHRPIVAGTASYHRSPVLTAIGGRPAIGYGGAFGVQFATAR